MFKLVLKPKQLTKATEAFELGVLENATRA
jgi:hypothetical protein